MSTPIPPNTKLEGIDLCAPRGARTPSAPLPYVSECDQERADEREQPSAAATEPPTAADTWRMIRRRKRLDGRFGSTLGGTWGRQREPLACRRNSTVQCASR